MQVQEYLVQVLFSGLDTFRYSSYSEKGLLGGGVGRIKGRETERDPKTIILLTSLKEKVQTINMASGET